MFSHEVIQLHYNLKSQQNQQWYSP